MSNKLIGKDLGKKKNLCTFSMLPAPDQASALKEIWKRRYTTCDQTNQVQVSD